MYTKVEFLMADRHGRGTASLEDCMNLVCGCVGVCMCVFVYFTVAEQLLLRIA